MSEIYYIGGSPCSGKSTIAELLAAKYGFAYYKLDDFLETHMKLAAKEEKPYSAASLDFDFEQMWMREPQVQADEEIAIYQEIFPYALRDIQEMGTEKAIVAEGAGFLPTLMAEMGIGKHHYICIVPTEAFQRENFAKRAWVSHFLTGCSSPETAFNNWMSRDAIFAKEILRQAEKFEYPSIVVDGKHSIEHNYRMVEKTFEFI